MRPQACRIVRSRYVRYQRQIRIHYSIGFYVNSLLLREYEVNIGRDLATKWFVFGLYLTEIEHYGKLIRHNRQYWHTLWQFVYADDAKRSHHFDTNE